MTEEKIIIRDLRRKEKFIIDDEYLNGYARICGIFATGVYVSLCRHADREQKAFPSIKRMAAELAISESSVKRGLKKLDEYRIIVRERKGKMLTNRYYLLDKSEWSMRVIDGSDGSVRPITQFRQTHHTVLAEPSIERKHNIKETQKKGIVKNFNFEDEKRKLVARMAMNTPQERTNIQEEVAARIRPSGIFFRKNS
jgi:DNA-binding transcriptional regulator PaaX